MFSLNFGQKYERPPNVFTIQSASGLQPFNKDLSQVNARSATLPRNMHSKVASNHNAQRSMSIGNSPDSKNSHDPGAKHKSPTSSNNSSKGDHILERVNHLQNSSAKVAIRVANQTQLNHEPGIVDGYLENVKHFIRSSVFFIKQIFRFKMKTLILIWFYVLNFRALKY